MNRKGFISLMTIFVIVMVLIVLIYAQKGLDTSTLDTTINSLNWTKFNVSERILAAGGEDKPYYLQVLVNVIDKAIEFFGYTVIEISKLAMKLAQDNPNIINWRVLFALIILSLIAPIIYPAFIICVSLILIIKEWWLVKKEKKELTRWKTKSQA